MKTRTHPDAVSGSAYEDSTEESEGGVEEKEEDHVSETPSAEGEFQLPTQTTNPRTRKRSAIIIDDSAEDELSQTMLHKKRSRVADPWSKERVETTMSSYRSKLLPARRLVRHANGSNGTNGNKPVVEIGGAGKKSVPPPTPVKERLRKQTTVNYSREHNPQGYEAPSLSASPSNSPQPTKESGREFSSDDEFRDTPRRTRLHRRRHRNTINGSAKYNLRTRSTNVSYKIEPPPEQPPPPPQYAEFEKAMAELRRAAEEKDALSDIDEAGDTARAAVGSRTPGNKESSSDDAEKVLPINLAELGVERCRKAGYFGEVGTNRVSSVTFDDVGGLDDYIRGLKEMVVLPLVYPEVCTGLGIKPPRGVLFHGPPGTGKTLLARALVQSCSDSSQRIAFFMCRGADILSKWVGEGERQLRVLFAQAQAFQPSIIFFDELDGLAPVRSARQEQAHASIVATLLALMDGIDDRGQVVVIGATNRPDSIDIALRRPGRFDREMLFRLPGNEARRRIIQIHTRRWAHKITAEEEKQLVDMTQGWGGADISALCTEAVLTALRRRYPQIYDSSQRLMVSVDNIKITMADVRSAASGIMPSTRRAGGTGTSPLPRALSPLLGMLVGVAAQKLSRSLGLFSTSQPEVYRPRLAVYGSQGMGVGSFGAATAHALEAREVPVFVVSAMSLFQQDMTPAANIARVFNEAQRRQPSVVYFPMVDRLDTIIDSACIALLDQCIASIAMGDRIGILVELEIDGWEDAPEFVQTWFRNLPKTCFVQVNKPGRADREKFFKSISQHIDELATRAREPEPVEHVEQAEAQPAVAQVDPRIVYRRLKHALLTVIEVVKKNRLLQEFVDPLPPETHSKFYEITKDPLFLDAIDLKARAYDYETVETFLNDIGKIADDWTAYKRHIDDYSEKVARRTQFLKDLTAKLVHTHVSPGLATLAEETYRKRTDPSFTEPSPPRPIIKPRRSLNNLTAMHSKQSNARDVHRKTLPACMPMNDNFGIPIVVPNPRQSQKELIAVLESDIVRATDHCSVEDLEALRVYMFNEINMWDARGKADSIHDVLRKSFRTWLADHGRL